MADQYYYETVLLLPMNGSNGSTAFQDASVRNVQMLTPNGGVTISTAQSKFGGASALFGGGTGYMVAKTFSLDIGTAPFTIEFWVRFTSLAAVQGLVNLRLGNSAGPMIRKNAANQIEFVAAGTSTPVGVTVALNTWYFISLDRRINSQMRLWMDGALVAGIQVNTDNLSSITGVEIGRDDNNACLSGYIDDLRITRFINRYESTPNNGTYTPPVAAFDASSAPVTGVFIDTPVAPVKVGGIPNATFKLISPAIMLRDTVWGGSGRVSGTTKVKGTPNYAVRRRVRLHREVDGMLVREQWSDATSGAYSFDSVDATKKYTVITYDYEHNFRAVIADNITPDPMP